MAHHNALLPLVYSYRSIKQMFTNVDQFKADSGDIFAWSDRVVLFSYSLTYENRSYADAKLLRHFYLCRGGAAHTFLFQDVLDSNTSASGVDEPFGTDQAIMKKTAPDEFSSDRFFLIKTYGSISKRILTPDVESITITIDGDPVDPENYSINPLSGEITTVLDMTDYRWGGQFYVPVRFGIETPNTIWKDENSVDIKFDLVEVNEDLVLPT